jgi:cysteine desulfurase/selenocysteine lyase
MNFPIFKNNKKLIYFDNAATSQKPLGVINAIRDYYLNSNSNVHRGIYDLSEKATELFENGRKKVAKFINARSEREIIFLRNTTEALNLLAFTLKPKEVTTTIMEHHSNYLPWERVAKLSIIDLNDEYGISNMEFRENISEKTNLLAITHASNVLGTINPIEKFQFYIQNSKFKIHTVVDGAQFIPHHKVDVQALGCAAYAFSGHKMYGPMGIGVLYVREELLKTLSPFMVGGGMFGQDYPWKFEAGTPDVAGVVGLCAAIDTINYKRIWNLESGILNLLLDRLNKIPEITIYGPKKNRVPVISFNVRGVHPHDVAQFLNDEYNLAVRAGHHCATPLHNRLGITASVRASLAYYNTEQEVEIFIKGIHALLRHFT